jgi:hypothetical protein
MGCFVDCSVGSFLGGSCGGIRAVLHITGSMVFLWMVAWTVSLTV